MGVYMQKALYEALILIFFSLIVAFVFNEIRPNGINLLKDDTKAYTKNGTSGLREISIKNAVKNYKKQKVLFIDARPEEFFINGHIKGALNLPDSQFEQWIEPFIEQTDPEQLIITYCDGIDCDLAENLAEKLYSTGFENIFYIQNGWSVWKANMPGEIKKNPSDNKTR